MYDVEYSKFLGSPCGVWVTKKVCDQRIASGLNPDGSDPLETEADLLLAQAVLEAQRQEDKSWTATQTAGVVIASLIGITLLVVVVKKINK